MLGIGVTVALVCAILISFVIPVDFTSRELMSRAQGRLDGMVLEIALEVRLLCH